MPRVMIEDVPVDFPHNKPYTIQNVYMQKVIQCLENSKNGVLESPTGTGKTISLLCSSLAWIQREKSKSVTQPNEDDTLNPPVVIPKIIYASRTHTQLTQAIKEFKATNYHNMKMAVLGSRDQYCIHPDLINESSEGKDRNCKSKTKTKTKDVNGQEQCGCTFYDGYNSGQSKLLNEVGNKIMDIEDLVTEGRKKIFCPYFLSRELAKHADIIFMPYNYLLDPQIRCKINDIELAGAIIILDEAHNIPQICEEAASVEFKQSHIAAAIEDVQFLVDLDYSTLACLEDVQKFCIADLTCLGGFVERLKKAIDDIELNYRFSAMAFDGGFIYMLMDKADIDFHTAMNIATLTSNVLAYLNAYAETFKTEHRGTGLKIFKNILWKVFLGGAENFRHDVIKHYRVYVELEKLAKPQPIPNKLINFWCFSPKFGLEYLLRRKRVRCIIFTSGTMTPMKPFIKCLGIPISVTLQNSHIIDRSQVHVQIISHGQDKETLSSHYENRSNPKYLQSLGSTILSLCAVIPNGLLIFFPSYIILDMCKVNWQASGIWPQIDQCKQIFIEPKSRLEFLDTMTHYYEKIKDSSSKGAIFMAVLRGKVSEGLDFADINGRAVIITGLPNLPIHDPKIKLKKRYMDECCDSDSDFQFDGNQWYCLEASRAVNQAIGRVIRHKNDFGAILLLDCRFHKQKSQLSLWLQDHLRNSADTFGNVISSISKFFRNQKSLPVTSELSKATLRNAEQLAQSNAEQLINLNSKSISTDSPMRECIKRINSNLLETPSPLPSSSLSENGISSAQKRKCCINLALNIDQ